MIRRKSWTSLARTCPIYFKKLPLSSPVMYFVLFCFVLFLFHSCGFFLLLHFFDVFFLSDAAFIGAMELQLSLESLHFRWLTSAFSPSIYSYSSPILFIWFIADGMIIMMVGIHWQMNSLVRPANLIYFKCVVCSADFLLSDFCPVLQLEIKMTVKNHWIV